MRQEPDAEGSTLSVGAHAEWPGDLPDYFGRVLFFVASVEV